MGGIVIVGGGQAATSLVARLRRGGYDGALTLIGDEPVPPYQRPPLSKAYLLGEMEEERLYLRPHSFYSENDVDLILSTEVTEIDRSAREIVAGDRRMAYETLVLCTGSRPRRLPASIGGDLGGVHTVRTLADVKRFAPEVRPGRRALVVGGGYIGLEAAAVLVKSGLSVTLVEMADRILNRVAAPETADYFRKLHQEHGVDLREGVGLSRLVGDERVSSAKLTDGTQIPVDVVIVGVGIEPETRLAKSADLDLDDGIATDAFGRTSDPNIWAAGDCASFPQENRRMRLESVGHAIDQAECVADNILGAERVYSPKPWFWSDQYNAKLQIAGLGAGYDRIVTRQGAAGTISFWYFAGPRLLAIDAINDPRAYMVGKRLIEGGKTVDPHVVSDPETDLKALLKA
ncbi:3-phenylpropionate/trans-cinnamate dioxygenase ferredoxin reductase subunit [Poseidonocella pacifica]|uniref:3-phenylpropionate/trans-cinnamate dioxygenase ferredoxin reductase subunit n=1 Tax=Poseidonocella pacifica TaxID=871651 RepID=A0A1I0XYZ1_9RHOB|nr:FAD-dependent oxidoreductase [Poseidonocella pacifica]SFB06271.1 3-phenylpropionate/trans-cinnamate dioxygenase ferredoxin reductase subunit [Poseidonocella pacifica]